MIAKAIIQYYISDHKITFLPATDVMTSSVETTILVTNSFPTVFWKDHYYSRTSGSQVVCNYRSIERSENSFD